MIGVVLAGLLMLVGSALVISGVITLIVAAFTKSKHTAKVGLLLVGIAVVLFLLTPLFALVIRA